MTTKQAAEALGLTPRRVRQLIRAHRLPAVKGGRDWLLQERDVARFEHWPRGRPPQNQEVTT